MKYDFDLDLSSKNSVSLIISKIKPGSTVLEFGPAAGRMTRYLKEELGCKVYIVEIDEEAAKKASVYAEEFVMGNIEDFIWFEKFKNISFDHIIFADVLEHLYNPQHVLKKCVELLDEKGTLVTSVPNIAHNSVIIDLLHNKFEYKKTGLLDDTHIRFFTYSSLVNMIHSCNLEINWEDAIVKSVGHTEFSNFFDKLPKEVAKYLKKRPFGDIYQFVLELKVQSVYPESSSKKSNIITTGDYYFTQLYIDCGDGFTESQSIRLRTKDNTEYYQFDTTGFKNIKSIRFDPLNTNCFLKFISISCIDMNNEERIVSDFTCNADFIFNDIYFFDHDDPQIFFDSINDELKEIRIQFSVLNYETEKSDWFLEILAEKKSQTENLIIEKSELSLKIADLMEKFRENDAVFIEKEQDFKKETLELKNEIDASKSEYNRLQIEIQNKDEQLKSKVKQLESVHTQLESLESKLSEIYSSKFWKVYTKLFK